MGLRHLSAGARVARPDRGQEASRRLEVARGENASPPSSRPDGRRAQRAARRARRGRHSSKDDARPSRDRGCPRARCGRCPRRRSPCPGRAAGRRRRRPRPRRVPSGSRVDEMGELWSVAGAVCWAAEDDVRVGGGFEQPGRRRAAGLARHARVEHLELRLDPALRHPRRERLDRRGGVDARAVAEVQRAEREAGHVGLGVARRAQHRGPLLELAESGRSSRRRRPPRGSARGSPLTISA